MDLNIEETEELLEAKLG